MWYRWSLICFAYCSHNAVLLFFFISYNWDLTRVTWRVLLVQQKILTLRNTLTHHSVFCVVHGAQSLVFCAIICSLLVVFMSFDRYTVGPSSTSLLITTLESSKWSCYCYAIFLFIFDMLYLFCYLSYHFQLQSVVTTLP